MSARKRLCRARSARQPWQGPGPAACSCHSSPYPPPLRRAAVHALSRVGRDLPGEHGEDQLPVPFGRTLVEDVAVGQRVAVFGALVNLVGVFDLAWLEQVAELGDHRQRCVRVVLGKTAIELAAYLGDAAM